MQRRIEAFKDTVSLFFGWQGQIALHRLPIGHPCEDKEAAQNAINQRNEHLAATATQAETLAGLLQDADARKSLLKLAATAENFGQDHDERARGVVRLWPEVQATLDLLPTESKPQRVVRRPASKAIFDDEAGTIEIDEAAIALEKSEKYVLQILVPKKAAKLSDLQSQATRPDKILRALLKKHEALKGYITLPGGPGRGGYSTTIKLKKQSSRTRQK